MSPQVEQEYSGAMEERRRLVLKVPASNTFMSGLGSANGASTITISRKQSSSVINIS